MHSNAMLACVLMVKETKTPLQGQSSSWWCFLAVSLADLWWKVAILSFKLPFPFCLTLLWGKVFLTGSNEEGMQKLKIKAAWSINYWGWFSLFLRGRNVSTLCWPSVDKYICTYIHLFWLFFMHLFLTTMTKFYQVQAKKPTKNLTPFCWCSSIVFTWIIPRQRECRNLIVSWSSWAVKFFIYA